MADLSQPVEPESAGTNLTPQATHLVEIVLEEDQSDRAIPANTQLESWALAALSDRESAATLAIKVVGAAEMAALNLTFAGKNKPTNVLSFPAEFSELPELPERAMEGTLPTGDLLGDIAICAEIVAQEAQAQGKTPAAHWAHMVVHGVLHLCGYDHINDDEAKQMEASEIQILESLGFPDPYAVDHHGAGPTQPLE